jgi:hypothetical protein
MGSAPPLRYSPRSLSPSTGRWPGHRSRSRSRASSLPVPSCVGATEDRDVEANRSLSASIWHGKRVIRSRSERPSSRLTVLEAVRDLAPSASQSLKATRRREPVSHASCSRTYERPRTRGEPRGNRLSVVEERTLAWTSLLVPGAVKSRWRSTQSRSARCRGRPSSFKIGSAEY